MDKSISIKSIWLNTRFPSFINSISWLPTNTTRRNTHLLPAVSVAAFAGEPQVHASCRGHKNASVWRLRKRTPINQRPKVLGCFSSLLSGATACYLHGHPLLWRVLKLWHCRGWLSWVHIPSGRAPPEWAKWCRARVSVADARGKNPQHLLSQFASRTSAPHTQRKLWNDLVRQQAVDNCC